MEIVTSIQLSVVSIHAPREGCDTNVLVYYPKELTFQFTHPGRGATGLIDSIYKRRVRFQFTHPGRGAT